MKQYFREAKERRDRLGASIGWGTGLIKTGQYLGGGGAIVFGFNAADEGGNEAAGRNAAYSGALAAGVTLIDELFDITKRREKRTVCADLTSYEITLTGTVTGWEYRADDPAFQNTFYEDHYKPTLDAIKDLHRKCTD
jgi:hypothetical protein